MRRFLMLVTAPLLAAGCATSTDDAPVPGTLELSMSDTALGGTFSVDDDELVFAAAEVAAGIYEMRLDLHGLTLEATVDTTDTLVIQRDGYATATGADTVLVEDDIALVSRFVKALEAEVPDIAKIEGVAQYFDIVIQKWAEWTPVMSLDQFEIQDPEHLTSMCYWAQDGTGSYTGCNNSYRWYDNGNHDCSTCNNGDARCQTIVQLGDHCGCSGDAFVWRDGAWRCEDQNHNARLYAVGNCYGRYGEGCGSGTSYNWESLKHDECVRNGHWTTSSWCSDELNHVGNSGNCY